MDRKELEARWAKIKSWKAKGKRAPHKPLLLLYALGAWQQGQTQLQYAKEEAKLKDYFREFSKSPSGPKPHYPFVFLLNDKVWELSSIEGIDKSKGSSSKRLRDLGISAQFPAEMQALLREQPDLIGHLAEQLLQRNFPESLHSSILQAVGLELAPAFLLSKRRKRDPRFRGQILEAYGYSCAVCGFNLRLGHQPLALEAAHIKWHQAGGPDRAENGLALCSMHHKLFDLGAFRIDDSLRLQVSHKVHGEGLDYYLLRHQAQQIRLPHLKKYRPKEDYLNWHLEEVFQGYSRD
ncbi:HNH endonuclease [Saprospira sp. CCB-QB6]|uniref:phosphorothioated DNA-binding restriction endonuclease n=1 Tax=Saprospira sp. CCB-QB6 TaxID=3023936 RepID=UPI00234A2972|nr:HNH endonuclease [Saprospira sp. CCB-QB6]WCL80040.1 HNH endonuclease [Saprospira sp. CCB-QB6]